MKLNEQITQLRRGRKMSQEELAEALQVSRQSVSKWENGLSNPDTENLIRLAEIFQVDVNLLVGSQAEGAEQPAPATQPPDRRKTVRMLSTLLAVALCLCGLFAGLWLWERYDRTDLSSMEPNVNTRWDSVTMYRNTDPVWVEVPLSEQEKEELSDRLWSFRGVEKTMIEPEKEFVYGEYGVLVCFTRGDFCFSWCIRLTGIEYSQTKDGAEWCHYVYEPDRALMNWTMTFANEKEN